MSLRWVTFFFNEKYGKASLQFGFNIIKMIKILSLWYSLVVLRFLKDNENKLFRNLERSTLKLEGNKSHLMFNETCHSKIFRVK